MAIVDYDRVLSQDYTCKTEASPLLRATRSFSHTGEFAAETAGFLCRTANGRCVVPAATHYERANVKRRIW